MIFASFIISQRTRYHNTPSTFSPKCCFHFHFTAVFSFVFLYSLLLRREKGVDCFAASAKCKHMAWSTTWIAMSLLLIFVAIVPIWSKEWENERFSKHLLCVWPLRTTHHMFHVIQWRARGTEKYCVDEIKRIHARPIFRVTNHNSFSFQLSVHFHPTWSQFTLKEQGENRADTKKWEGWFDLGHQGASNTLSYTHLSYTHYTQLTAIFCLAKRWSRFLMKSEAYIFFSVTYFVLPTFSFFFTVRLASILFLGVDVALHCRWYYL